LKLNVSTFNEFFHDLICMLFRLSIKPTDYQIKDLSGRLWMDFWYLFDYTLICYFKR